jgi:hypothetical protein
MNLFRGRFMSAARRGIVAKVRRLYSQPHYAVHLIWHYTTATSVIHPPMCHGGDSNKTKTPIGINCTTSDR